MIVLSLGHRAEPTMASKAWVQEEPEAIVAGTCPHHGGRSPERDMNVGTHHLSPFYSSRTLSHGTVLPTFSVIHSRDTPTDMALQVS